MDADSFKMFSSEALSVIIAFKDRADLDAYQKELLACAEAIVERETQFTLRNFKEHRK